MADWKNNKILGIAAGVVGVALIVLAAFSVIRMVSSSKQVPPPKVEMPKVK